MQRSAALKGNLRQVEGRVLSRSVRDDQQKDADLRRFLTTAFVKQKIVKWVHETVEGSKNQSCSTWSRQKQ